MTPPRDSHPIGWLMVGVAVVLAAAGYVAALVTYPVTTGVVTSQALIGLWAWWFPNRAIRAELESARYRLAVYNGSETHEALAEVGPVTGPSNVVELFDQDALAEMRTQAEPVRDDQCAVSLADDDEARQFLADIRGKAEPVTSFPPPEEPLSDQEWNEYADFLGIDRSDHLGQACDHPRGEPGGPTCDRPAGRWVRWDNGHIEWLCDEHHALVMGEDPTQPCWCAHRPGACLRHPGRADDDGSETLPRSLPGRDR